MNPSTRSATPGARHPELVAIAAGKGGVGTSTTSALLASVLAANGHRVLLVDAANRLGTLDTMFGVTPTGSLANLRAGRIDAESLMVTVSEGLTLLPVSSAADRSITAAERRALLGRVRALFPRYDLVLFDAGSSAESVLDVVATGVTRVLAVTAGDRITITATFALIKLLHERDAGLRVDLLANRIPESIARLAHDAVNQATVRFLARTVHLAGIVPDDSFFGTALTAGLGSRVATEGSSAALVMHDLGALLLGSPHVPGAHAGLTS